MTATRRDDRKASLVAILILLLPLVLLPSASSANGIFATMWLSAAPTSGSVGDTIAVTVNVAFNNGLVSADFGVSYDPAVLSFSSAAPGNINNGWFDFTVDNPAGVVNISTFDLSGVMNFGSGSLAVLDFDILSGAAAGLTSLDIVGIYPSGQIALGYETLPQLLLYETVNTSGTSLAVIPLPPVWLLMVSGLLALGWARRGSRD